MQFRKLEAAHATGALPVLAYNEIRAKTKRSGPLSRLQVQESR